MTTFTLDTNCIIAVDASRPEAASVLRLADAHKAGIASVALVAISASERQQSGQLIETFDTFKDRLRNLGLDHIDLIMPMLYLDVTFLDFSLLSDKAMQDLEQKIHAILFPNIELQWNDYCAARNLNVNTTSIDNKWRNAKCDVQAFWSHIYAGRNCFVTSDTNFLRSKKPQLLKLAGGRIETPQSAAVMLF